MIGASVTQTPLFHSGPDRMSYENQVSNRNQTWQAPTHSPGLLCGNCDRSVRHYFWLFFSVLTTETDVWEVQKTKLIAGNATISHYCKQFSYSGPIGIRGFYTGGSIFKTQRKRIITLQTNKWRSLLNHYCKQLLPSCTNIRQGASLLLSVHRPLFFCDWCLVRLRFGRGRHLYVDSLGGATCQFAAL